MIYSQIWMKAEEKLKKKVFFFLFIFLFNLVVIISFLNHTIKFTLNKIRKLAYLLPSFVKQFSFNFPITHEKIKIIADSIENSSNLTSLHLDLKGSKLEEKDTLLIAKSLSK